MLNNIHVNSSMKAILVFVLLFGFQKLTAQELETKIDVKDSIILLGEIVRDHQEFAFRRDANERLLVFLSEYIQSEEGYVDPLKEVTSMVALSSKKNDFRIFTWLMRDSLFQLKSFGIVATKVKKKIIVTILEDQKGYISEPELKVLDPNQWYGAVYYKLIEVKRGRKKIYTLLGYSPGKPVQHKVIEAATVDIKGTVKFGSKIFYLENFMDKKFFKPPMRLILYYSSDYSASVKWNEEEEMVIMDHLAPPNPRLKGLYDLYGPDMTYDGLKWDGNWWTLIPTAMFNSGQEVEFTEPDKPVGPPSRKP